MDFIIDNVDFFELPAQKYWTPAASRTPEQKKAEIESAIFGMNYTGARKMDGAFYKFIKGMDGEMVLIGRSKSVKGTYLNKIGHVPHLLPFFENLPNGTCLLGEIYFPKNEGSNHVTTIMGCLESKAVARQNAGDKLWYYVFDVLAWDGKSLVNSIIEDRIKILQKIFNDYSKEYIICAQYYEGKELWNHLQEILATGGEGIVITKKGTCYQPGKRPAHQTIKVKKELQETIDVIVLGANPPSRLYTGKEIEDWEYWEDPITSEKFNSKLFYDYQNGRAIEPVTKNYFYERAGSLVIGVYKDAEAVPIGSVSGLTEEVLSNWKDYVGKVAEIGGMEIMQDTLGIRHPKFIQWRPDLRPQDTDWYRTFGKK